MVKFEAFLVSCNLDVVAVVCFEVVYRQAVIARGFFVCEGFFSKRLGC